MVDCVVGFGSDGGGLAMKYLAKWESASGGYMVRGHCVLDRCSRRAC